MSEFSITEKIIRLAAHKNVKASAMNRLFYFHVHSIIIKTEVKNQMIDFIFFLSLTRIVINVIHRLVTDC